MFSSLSFPPLPPHTQFEQHLQPLIGQIKAATEGVGVRESAEGRQMDSGKSEGTQGDVTDRIHIKSGHSNNCGTNLSGLSIHSV